MHGHEDSSKVYAFLFWRSGEDGSGVDKDDDDDGPDNSTALVVAGQASTKQSRADTPGEEKRPAASYYWPSSSVLCPSNKQHSCVSRMLIGRILCIRHPPIRFILGSCFVCSALQFVPNLVRDGVTSSSIAAQLGRSILNEHDPHAERSPVVRFRPHSYNRNIYQWYRPYSTFEFRYSLTLLEYSKEERYRWLSLRHH
jgi:hypothetical protein